MRYFLNIKRMNFNIHFLTINSKISSLLCPLSLQPLLLQACYHPLSTACHCWWSVDCCPSPTTHRLVLVACWSVPITHCSLPIVPYPSPSNCYPLLALASHYLLLAAHHPSSAICRLLSFVHWPLLATSPSTILSHRLQLAAHLMLFILPKENIIILSKQKNLKIKGVELKHLNIFVF